MGVLFLIREVVTAMYDPRHNFSKTKLAKSLNDTFCSDHILRSIIRKYDMDN